MIYISSEQQCTALLFITLNETYLAHSPTASMSAIGVFEHFPPSQLTCLQSTSYRHTVKISGFFSGWTNKRGGGTQNLVVRPLTKKIVCVLPLHPQSPAAMCSFSSHVVAWACVDEV